MTQSKNVIFFGLLITLLLSGCHQGKRSKTENDKSNTAKRLIVTNSDAFEMLIGLGAAENIVGIHEMTLKSYIDEDQHWPSIGHWRNPNIEAITNLNPDIVVAYQKWPEPTGFDDKLKPFNISVERINCFYMSEYHSDIYRLASFVDKKNRADTMIHDFDRIIGMIKDAVKNVEVKKKVYFESYSDFAAMGAGTGVNEILELVNTTNIAAKLGIQYPKVSTEWLLEENPDIIIKAVSDETITEDMYEKLVNRAGWDKLDAVKNRQVYLVVSDLSSGPRAMIGSLYVGKWCYPERFVSMNPDSMNLQWMKKYYGVTTPDNLVLTFKKQFE